MPEHHEDVQQLDVAVASLPVPPLRLLTELRLERLTSVYRRSRSSSPGALL